MFDDKKDKIPPRPNLTGNGRPNHFALIFFLLMVGLFIFYFYKNNDGPAKQEIPYSAFTKALELNEISEVTIYENNSIEGLRHNGGTKQYFKTQIPYQDPGLLPMLREKGVNVSGAAGGISPMKIFFDILPWIIGFGLIWFMFRNMQGSGNKAFQFGKSRAKRYHDEGKKITFQDVAGQKDAKYELEEVVSFLKDPQKFTKMGARIPKGVLLVGMPGTGKTLMAKAVAGEAKVAYFH
ncbi:MAG: ATP-dependent metallopeptidase FtsH/Yme1/Tma family protein, partial [Treponema sp.]|nr:ATP-dependent metallopeptidase FtsH/Yme1/Tma family protein [Treponema sp.]